MAKAFSVPSSRSSSPKGFPAVSSGHVPTVGTRKFTRPSGGRKSAYNYPDLDPPGCVISTDADEPVTDPFTATFTFTEIVTGFVVGDITVQGVSASGFDTEDNKVFTATMTPTSGAIEIQVAADVCTDLAGNNNTESNLIELAVE